MLQQVQEVQEAPTQQVLKPPRLKSHKKTTQNFMQIHKSSTMAPTSLSTAVIIDQLPRQQSEQPQPTSPQCRICLQSETPRDNPMITPCKCTGSVKYVHQMCYRRWVQRLFVTKDKKEQGKMMEDGVECEMCKYRVQMKFFSRYECTKCESLKNKISKNKPLFVLFLIFLALNLGSLSYLTLYTTQNVKQLDTQIISLALVVASYIFLGITLIITLIYFILDYFVDRTTVLESFETPKLKNKPKNNGRYQVHPLSIEELNQ